MRRFRESNFIPSTSTERILPEEIIDRYLGRSGIQNGGTSILRTGAQIERNTLRPYHIVIISLRGEGKFQMEDGTQFVLEPGSIFFSHADGQGHRHGPISPEWELCWLHVDEDAEWLTSPPPDYTFRPCPESRSIGNCIDSLLEEDILRQKEFGEIEDLQSRLLFHYLRRALSAGTYRGRQLHYVKLFNNLWNAVATDVGRKWTVEDVCAYVHLSKAQATRVCRELFGQSPASKIAEIKMRHASAMLSYFNVSVSAVAESVGYESVSSFSVAFKNHFGFSPKKLVLQEN